MDNYQLIAALIVKRLKGELTGSEATLLSSWENQSIQNKELSDQLTDPDYLQEEVMALHDSSQRILQKIKEAIPEAVVIPMHNKINWRRWAAAASILLLIGVSYYVISTKEKSQPAIAKTQTERFKNDVNPGGYKAKLTLADGSTIILDSAAIGELTKQGGTVVLNKDGQLVYDVKSKTTEVLYNTLSTSKGETYATVLADGSKVWLNSASSIKYPVAFVGNERKVEITGEAYFEVKTSPQPSPLGEGVVKRPFIVSVNGMEVQVLGTHFNINSYSDEAVIKTTLLEGAVKILRTAQDDKAVVLKPGQQAQLNKAGEIKLVADANTEQAVAWVNGVFDCNGLDISAIMRQVGRWYDVEISIDAAVTKDKFAGKIPRTVTLTNLLKVLELNDVKFTVEGKKIRVMK